MPAPRLRKEKHSSIVILDIQPSSQMPSPLLYEDTWPRMTQSWQEGMNLTPPACQPDLPPRNWTVFDESPSL